jgi:hypothetical protein
MRIIRGVTFKLALRSIGVRVSGEPSVSKRSHKTGQPRIKNNAEIIPPALGKRQVTHACSPPPGAWGGVFETNLNPAV